MDWVHTFDDFGSEVLGAHLAMEDPSGDAGRWQRAEQLLKTELAKFPGSPELARAKRALAAGSPR